MKSKILLFTAIGIFIVSTLFFLFTVLNESDSSGRSEDLKSTSKNQTVVATVTVTMKSGPNAFEPSALNIKKDTKVIFKNEDTVDRWPASDLHPTHGIYPEFDPQEPVTPGSEWSFVFDKVGNWKYHDHLIPSFRGEIKVEE